MSDVSKLPKWAQQRIRKLEADVTYWQGKASVGPEESDTFRHEYGERGADAGQPLGAGANIRFEVDENRRLFARLRGGALEVHASGRGFAALQVKPVASNVVRIEVADR